MATKIDDLTLQRLRCAMDSALEDVGKQFGVSIKTGNASYTPQYATYKVSVSTINSNGEIVDKYAIDYQNRARMYGLDPKWLNEEFEYKGKTYILKGLNTMKSRYPIVALRDHGGTTLFTIDAIKQAFDSAKILESI